VSTVIVVGGSKLVLFSSTVINKSSTLSSITNGGSIVAAPHIPQTMTSDSSAICQTLDMG
jgi:hypothetical protein